MRNVIYGEHIDGISIDRIAREYAYTMPAKHTHDEYEIYYLVEGERYYFIEASTYHIKKGNLVFINCNQIHKTGQYGNSYHERIAIEFQPEPFSSFLACTGELSLTDFFQNGPLILELSKERQKYVLALLDSIAAEMRLRDPGYRMMTMTKLAKLLFFSLRLWHSGHPLSSASVKSSTHQKVSEVAAYIAAHYASAKSLDHIAKHFYISKSYLSRIFKEITGYTVTEYLNVNRIQEARRLLLHTSLPVSAIAQMLGYESITYFEKVFRTYTETSPLKYRKRLKPELAARPKTFRAEMLAPELPAKEP